MVNVPPASCRQLSSLALSVRVSVATLRKGLYLLLAQTVWLLSRRLLPCRELRHSYSTARRAYTPPHCAHTQRPAVRIHATALCLHTALRGAHTQRRAVRTQAIQSRLDPLLLDRRGAASARSICAHILPAPLRATWRVRQIHHDAVLHTWSAYPAFRSPFPGVLYRPSTRLEHAITGPA